MVWKLHNDGHDVYAYPGSDGMRQWAEVISEGDPLAIAKEQEVDLTIVGPEAPLADGIVDRFLDQGEMIFGPKQAAAKLESSKSYAKEFMRRYGVPTALSQTCQSKEKAIEAAKELLNKEGVVIKATGLAAGKGVVVCDTLEEAKQAIEELQVYGNELLVEERLSGPEASLLFFSDGQSIVPFPSAQDYKRLEEGGQGPNTGGMGAISPSPYFIEADEVIARTAYGLQEENLDYRGFLYIGVMLTPEGAKVLEYNCRLGDPEAQVLLPLLESDFALTCLAAAQGNLQGAPPYFREEASCCLVLAAAGYPQSPQKGVSISGLSEVRTPLFHAGTKQEGVGSWQTAGGRVLSIVATAQNLSEATKIAYREALKVSFKGAFFRKDIGHLLCK